MTTTSPAAALHLLPPRRTPARFWAVVLMIVMPLFCGVLALLLGADASWDLRNYHWYNAWAYLNGRHDTDFMPSQGQFFLNPWLDVPFYVLATHVPPAAAFFILGVIQGLNFPLLFMTAYATLSFKDQQAKVLASAALATAGLFSAIGISEIGACFYDNVTSLGVLASLLMLLHRINRLQEGPERPALFYAGLAGLPAGLMTGLKMTCAPYSIGLCLALLVFSPQQRRCFLLSLCFGLGVLAGFIATYGHWGWHLYTHYDSPTFPFFNILFHSPLLPSDSLILDFAPPHNWRLLVFPFLFGVEPRLVNEVGWEDWRIPALYGLFLWLLVQYKATKKRARGGAIAEAPPARFLLLWGFVSYYCWVLSETVYRYLMPLDMMAPLLIVICIGLLPATRGARVIAAAAVVAALSLTIQPANWGRHEVMPAKMSAAAPVPHLAPDTLVLMAGLDAYGYLLPALPPEAQYLRIESRGFPAKGANGINDLIRRKLAAHKGPLMLLMPARDIARSDAVLDAMGLKLLPGCHTAVIDMLSEPVLDRPSDSGNAYAPAYNLCRVMKALP